MEAEEASRRAWARSGGAEASGEGDIVRGGTPGRAKKTGAYGGEARRTTIIVAKPMHRERGRREKEKDGGQVQQHSGERRQRGRCREAQRRRAKQHTLTLTPFVSLSLALCIRVLPLFL